MPQTTTSIAVVGNDDYRKALRAEAARRGLQIAQLVREALDSYAGAELAAHEARFAAESGSKHHHMEVISNN